MLLPISRLHFTDARLHMTAIIKAKRFWGLLGFVGFLLCGWFAYQCGLGARDSANRAYSLWLSEPGQSNVASRQNGLWVLALGASLLLGLLFLATSFYSKRTVILRKGLGLILLVGSCLPVSFAFTIFHNSGGNLSPGARVTSWSTGGITLQGWQMYAGGVLFALAALSMVIGGAYLLVTRPIDD